MWKQLAIGALAGLLFAMPVSAQTAPGAPAAPGGGMGGGMMMGPGAGADGCPGMSEMKQHREQMQKMMQDHMASMKMHEAEMTKMLKEHNAEMQKHREELKK